MEPGDTQEVVVGIIIGRSTSNIKSVKELKIKDQAAQFAYDADFNIPPSPPAPNTHAFEGDGFVNLWWEDNAEAYDNRFYKFEGYRIFQFRNSAQSLDNGEMLDIFDIKNNISVIEDFVKVNGERIIAPVILANNSGIFRSYKLTTDSYTNGPLVDANPYYFAVTSYAVAKSPDITPAFLESPPKIMEVFPGRRDADDNLSVSLGEDLFAKHAAGLGDAKVMFRVVDPRSLLDADYAMSFDTLVVVDSTGETSLAYTVVKTVGSTKDTIITNSMDFSPDEENKIINDGLMIIVDNYGVDSLAAVAPVYRVKDIIEVVNTQGVTLDPPVNVYYDIDTNATAADGSWYIKSATGSGFVWQKTATKQGLKFDYYEIRFTGTSQFYTAAKLFSDKPTKNSDLGVGTLPFEIWDIGRNIDDPSDDQRLIIKVLDKTITEGEAVQDSQWTKLPNGDWEQLYAYYDPDLDPANLDAKSGKSQDADHKFGRFVFHGDLPAAGSGVVIRMRTYQGLSKDDNFVFNGKSQNFSDPNVAKQNLDKITVFPNPYFGSNDLETSKYLRFVRFTGLPKHTIIRIFSLSGVYITKLEKNDPSQYLDWNLLNKDALPIASGMYIAHVDMPGVGTKILKIAVILEQQYIDRL
jgi:hypothetical protein